MKDELNLEQQLIEELTQVQHRIDELERVDIARRESESALKESGERYRRLFEAVTDYVYTVKVEEGRAISTTHGTACLKVTGYTASEYERDPDLWFRMIHENDREMVLEQVNRIFAGEPTSTMEHRIIHKNGSIRWISNTPVPYYDGEGRLILYDGIITGITDRKEIEGEKEALIIKLQEALSNIKALSGLLPICSSCKKIRNDKGYWEQIEVYIRDHSQADFSHGLCPECAERLYPEYYHKK